MAGSPAMEQAEIRRALTQAARKVAVDPAPQGMVDPRAAGAQANKEQQRSGAQCVGMAMNKMNDHGINIK
jgi:hypothetical protein